MRPVTVSVGPNASASTRSSLVRMDEWAGPYAGLQVNVSGTVNYTVQYSYDDPNSPTNPVAENSMTWFSSADSNVVNATAAKTSNFNPVPTFVSLLLNSGSGTATMTIVQQGVVPY